MSLDAQRRAALLAKLGAVCADIARLKAGEDATLATLAAPGTPSPAGVDPLTRLEGFKALLNERLEALVEGRYGRCEECGRALSPAELNELPWVTSCQEC